MFETLSAFPLNSLRVFEAAARLGSFARAASELNITPAAVSQQIKKIEARCGLRLFERTGRQVRLTERGERFRSGVADGFRILDLAARDAMRRSGSASISISTVNSIATRWLVPRLDRWRAKQPDIDIWVSSSGQFVDFNSDRVDLGIRIGSGDYPGLESELLLRDRILPICHPNFLSGDRKINQPEDLARNTLIHFTPIAGDVKMDWKGWLDANGVQNVDAERGLFFNDLVAAINAAMMGQGVLLALHSLVESDLQNGLLVAPFGERGHRRIDWHLVRPRRRPANPHLAEFREWLISEARGKS